MGEVKNLKNCPFCGSDNLKKQSIAIHRDFSRWIHCDTSFSHGPMVYEKRDEKEAWQTRPIEVALRAEISKLRAELEQERAKNSWIPVSTPPEDDGTLQIAYCFSTFTGNYYEIQSCYFWCRIEYIDSIFYDVFAYHFNTGNWIPKNQKGFPSDFAKYITHYKPLPEPQEQEVEA